MLGQYYRFQITSVMSLMHRVSGIVLAMSAFGLAWWLLSVARGGEAWATASAVFGSLPGKALVFLASLALVYHFFNGIRHLLWDAGWGFEIPQVYRSGYTVAALTVVFTAAIWFVALGGAA